MRRTPRVPQTSKSGLQVGNFHAKKRGFFAKNLKRLNEKQIAAIIEFDLWGRSLYEWPKMLLKSLLFLDER